MRFKYIPREGDHGVHGYEHCIRSDLNTTADLFLFHYQQICYQHLLRRNFPLLYSHLPLQLLMRKNMPYIVLHPLYLGRKLIPSSQVNNIYSIFSQRFSELFRAKYEITYGRLLSGEGLLLLYSTPSEILPDHTLWPGLDVMIDTLFPGSIPFLLRILLSHCHLV